MKINTQSLAFMIIIIAFIGVITIQLQKTDEIRVKILNNISSEVRDHNDDVKEIIQKQLNLTLIEDTNHLLHDVMNLLGNRTVDVTSQTNHTNNITTQ